MAIYAQESEGALMISRRIPYDLKPGSFKPGGYFEGYLCSAQGSSWNAESVSEMLQKQKIYDGVLRGKPTANERKLIFQAFQEWKDGGFKELAKLYA